MPSRRTFRLYILGRLSKGDMQRFAVLAEFRAARAIERVKVRREQLDELTSDIDQLRAFVELGGTEFDQAKLRRLGDRLFRLILRGKVRDLFIRATGQELVGVPCEVLVEDHALAGWPWEYLYDRTNEKFICQEFHPISRGIFTLVPGRPLGPRKGKLRVLVVVGARSDDAAIRPEEELKAILNVFQERTLDSDSVTFRPVQSDRPTDILRYLQAERFDVLHYVGHAGVDTRERQGYLRFDRGDGNEFRFYARDFSALLIDRGIRLVVLNGCNTARGEPGMNPANSAFATALLDRGVPAVMATQFAMPESGARYFSSLFYGALAQGKTLVEAMSDGRSSMLQADERAYFDWGIPVLYTTDPNLVVYQPRERASVAPRGASAGTGVAGREGLGADPDAGPQSVPRRYTKRVAIADFDATVAFLPELVRAANAAQDYFRFEFLPTYLPAGALGGAVDETQLLLYRLDAHLKDLPQQYGVDEVLCLTRHRITIREEDDSLTPNLMVASPESNPHVSMISTYKLREYARRAEIGFAKATLYLCVGALIGALNFSEDEDAYHEETAGCPLDYCGNPDDVVEGLRAMSFTHAPCVARVKDAAQLQAIRRLLAVTTNENYDEALGGGRRRKRSTNGKKAAAETMRAAPAGS